RSPQANRLSPEFLWRMRSPVALQLNPQDHAGAIASQVAGIIYGGFNPCLLFRDGDGLEITDIATLPGRPLPHNSWLAAAVHRAVKARHLLQADRAENEQRESGQPCAPAVPGPKHPPDKLHEARTHHG